jgi:hypothetical protein
VVTFVLALAVSRFARAEGEEGPPQAHAPVTMRIALVVTELARFDLATGAFDVEMLALVQCDADPCKPDLDVANGRLLARPDVLRDEPRSKLIRLKAALGAPIDLAEYPFDGHELPIVLQDRRDPMQVTYQVDRGRTAIREGVRLPGWELAGWSAAEGALEVGDGRRISQVRVAIDARRPAIAAALKALAPAVVMVLVAAFTLLLRPKSASARLSLATGGLLALVMFQVAEVASLPPVAYLTRFDKLMIATYVVHLLNLALSVAMLRLGERGATKAYLVAAGAVPGLALFLWTAVLVRLV